MTKRNQSLPANPWLLKSRTALTLDNGQQAFTGSRLQGGAQLFLISGIGTRQPGPAKPIGVISKRLNHGDSMLNSIGRLECSLQFGQKQLVVTGLAKPLQALFPIDRVVLAQLFLNLDEDLRKRQLLLLLPPESPSLRGSEAESQPLS